MPDIRADVSPLGPVALDTAFFGHPRGLATLFFTEMWERFSFYGMRALLILFMTAPVAGGGLGLDVATAGVIYGLYTAMSYLAALPGGWIADRILGLRRAVFYGGLLIAAGNFVLSIPGAATFYGGLAFVIAGTGLLKPNVSAIVGQLYSQADPRRDAGFSVFYMGINLGAFLAPLLCGWVAFRYGWRLGFLLAAVGMTVGVVQYMLGSRTLGSAGLLPAKPDDFVARRQLIIGGLIVALVVGSVAALSAFSILDAKTIGNASGAILLLVVVLLFVGLLSAAEWTQIERKRLMVVLLLFLAACIFWSVFEQAGSSLNLFAQRNTDNQVAGFHVPPPWYQSINALFIITLAPVFGALWLQLGTRQPSSPAKFAWGLVLAGFGFIVMAGAASLSSTGIKVSPVWLFVTYLFHTAGELCLSPVGLSAMTKLAPARVGGLMMGVWFLSISVGNYLGGRLASFYESLPLDMLFGVAGAIAIAAGILLAFLVKPIVRLMGGVR